MSARQYAMEFAIGAKLSGQFNAAFKGAGSTIQSLQGKIQSLQKAQGDIAAYQKQQSAIEKTRSKLELLRKQYANLQAEMGESDNASAALKNQMLAKQQQIDRTSVSLDTQTKRLDVMGNALRQAGVDTKDLAAESAALAAQTDKLKQQQDAEAAAMQEAAASAERMGNSYADAASDMEQMLAAAGLFAALREGAEILQACTAASIEFESVMTGVDKTTDLTAKEFAEMSAAVKQLSTEIPVTTTELGEVGEVAGQLGIAKENMLNFSRVMTMLSTATTMAADEAATMSAQFANITGMDPSKYANLGSTIVDLGNNYATTEQKILEMGHGIAASGSLAGMSEADMMGLSAAVTSLGIETQAGSTSMSTLISTLNKAVETGEGLTDYASVANMSAAEFTRAWGTDAAGALAQFITGLADTERNGKSAVVILDELGISETRLQRMMLSLATSGDLMSRAISTANTAWQENTALTAEAEKRYATTESRLQMASNAANNLKIAVGDALTPAVGTFADVAKDALIGVTGFVEENPALVQGMVTAGGVIGGVTLAVTGYSAAAKVAAAASALLTSAIPGAKTLMLVTAGVAALSGVVVGLSNAMKDTSVDFATLDADFDSLNEQLAEQERISDLIDEYKSLSKELSGVSDAAGDINGGEASIQITPEATDTLGMTDFVPGYDVDNPWVTLIKGQRDKNADPIDPSEFVGKKAVDIKGNALPSVLAKNLLDGDDFILVKGKEPGTDQLLKVDQFVEQNREVLLTADKAEGFTLEAASFLDGTTVTILGKKPEEAKDLVQAIDLVAEGAAKIVATPDEEQLVAAELFLKPESTVPLTADPNEVESTAFFAGGKAEVDLSALPQKVAPGDFVRDGNAEISGQANREVAPADFVKTENALISGQANKSVSASDFLVDNVSTIDLKANITNLADVQAEITALQSEAASLQTSVTAAKTELDNAKADLATLQDRRGELSSRENAAQTKEGKSALQEEIEALDKQITAQIGHVGELQNTYTALSNELTIIQTAAAELTAKKQRLAEVTAELTAASGGVITATGEETDAFNQQVETLAALNKAKKAGLRAELYANATAQAEKYAEAVKASAEYTADMAPLTNQAKVLEQYKYLNISANEVNAAYQGLLVSMDEMASKGYHPIFNDDMQATILQLQVLSDLMGANFDDMETFALQQYVGARNISWVDFFGNARANGEKWNNTIITMGEKIDEYGADVEEANKTQDAFIQNLVNGLQQGYVTIEEVEAMLTNTFSTTENGGELVAGVMAEIQTQMALVSESAEDMGEGMSDGMDGAAASAAELNDAINPILAQMQKLGEAYDEAYQAAYESMDGQFELFEKAPEVTATSIDAMMAGLNDQTKYMREYTANLRALQDIGINPELIAQLSDGSAESAAYVAALAEDVANGSKNIDDFNAAYKEAEKAKKDFAAAAAELQTDFGDEMSDLQAELTATVSKMDKSAEAAEAGEKTVQAFADAAAALTPTVQAKFKAVADAAKSALHVNVRATPVGISAYASGTDDAERGFALVGEKGPEIVWFNGGEKVFNNTETQVLMNHGNEPQNVGINLSDYLPGYASGTDDAERGWAMVGENGPELMWFNGGEKVLNNAETEALMNRSSEPLTAISSPASAGLTFTIEVSPIYNINGSANADEIRGVFTEQNVNLRALIEDTIEEIEQDRERSRYS